MRPLRLDGVDQDERDPTGAPVQARPRLRQRRASAGRESRAALAPQALHRVPIRSTAAALAVMKRKRLHAWPRHPVTGAQFRVSADTRRQLESILGLVRQMRLELRLGVRSVVDVDRQLRRLAHGPITVARAVDAYVGRSDLSADTRRRVRSWLRGPGRELRGRELDDLDGPTCAAWLGRVRGRSAASSTRTTWNTLCALVRYAAERGWIARLPWGAWRPTGRTVGGPARASAAGSLQDPRRARGAARGGPPGRRRARGADRDGGLPRASQFRARRRHVD